MIIRTEKNSHYTTIANFALEDPQLSLKAKGLWAFIMSKPDEWNLSSRGLESQLKEGRDAIMAALKELEQAGYLVRGERRQTNGKWTTGANTLHERPAVVGKSNHGSSHHGKAHHIVKTKQVSTKQDNGFKNPLGAEAPVVYGDKEVKQLQDFWVFITGLPIQSQVQSNRRACYRLIRAMGLEEAKRLIQRAAQTKGVKGAPIIVSPLQLERKQSDLREWEDRQTTPAALPYPDVKAMLYPDKYGKGV